MHRLSPDPSQKGRRLLTDPIKGPKILSYLVALAAIVAALAMRLPLYPLLGTSRPYLTLFGGVALSVWVARWKPAALAAVFGFLAANYYFAAPQNAFALNTFFVTEFVFYSLSVGLIIATGESLHRARDRIALEAEERRNAEELIRSVVNNVIDGIIAIDERGVVQSLNPAAERLFGYPASEVIHQNIKILMPPPYHDEHDSYIGNYLRTGEAKIIGIGREVVGRRKDGSTFPMELAVSEFWVGDLRHFTGIVRDITGRKQAEEALREADRRKNEFLATLAHELRNSLAPVCNSLEIMRLAGTDPAAVEQSLGTMERQLDQMVRLVDDLLDVARISRGKIDLRKERVELASIVHQAIEICRPLAETMKHEVSVALPSEPIHLHADSVRLTQVVSNLLNNACKYTEPGGRIWLTAQRQGSDVLVSVKDTGIGIPPDMLPRVFEMFTQVDQSLERSQGGLGIGLTLVKQLVELHDGTVEASSDGSGLGSEFVVRLPLVVETSETPEPTTPTASQDALARRRILVVDDNKDSAESLARLLQLKGHETYLAHDGLEALEAAEQFRPELVLLDIGLPRLNGFEVCRRIREQSWGQAMVLLALTGWGQEEDRLKSKDAGFDRHLVKPVHYDSLIKLLVDLQPTQD